MAQAHPLPLNRKQPRKERSVAAQRQPKILGRSIFAAVPLLLELLPLASEDLAQPTHCRGNQRVGFSHGLARLVDESGLNAVPSRSKFVRFGRGEEGNPFLVHRAGRGSGAESLAMFAGRPGAGGGVMSVRDSAAGVARPARFSGASGSMRLDSPAMISRSLRMNSVIGISLFLISGERKDVRRRLDSACCLRARPDRFFRQLVEQRAVMNHPLAKFFGGGLAPRLPDRDVVRGAVVLNHHRVIH